MVWRVHANFRPTSGSFQFRVTCKNLQDAAGMPKVRARTSIGFAEVVGCGTGTADASATCSVGTVPAETFRARASPRSRRPRVWSVMYPGHTRPLQIHSWNLMFMGGIVLGFSDRYTCVDVGRALGMTEAVGHPYFIARVQVLSSSTFQVSLASLRKMLSTDFYFAFI